VTGNPGLLNYYLPFLHHLHGLLPPTHAILSTSHIGHSPSLPAPPAPLDLPQQLEAKVELVSALRSTLDAWHVQAILDSRSEAGNGRSAEDSAGSEGSGPPPPRLDLMGHSVGAWILCEVMKRLPGDVGRGFMLFPTVGWISESWNGRTLWVSLARGHRGSQTTWLADISSSVYTFVTSHGHGIRPSATESQSYRG
jgi:hypothetical protein